MMVKQCLRDRSVFRAVKVEGSRALGYGVIES